MSRKLDYGMERRRSGINKPSPDLTLPTLDETAKLRKLSAKKTMSQSELSELHRLCRKYSIVRKD